MKLHLNIRRIQVVAVVGESEDEAVLELYVGGGGSLIARMRREEMLETLGQLRKATDIALEAVRGEVVA